MKRGVCAFCKQVGSLFETKGGHFLCKDCIKQGDYELKNENEIDELVGNNVRWAIKELFRKNPEPKTAKEIAERLGKKHRDVRNSLNGMRVDKEIKTLETNYGLKQYYFSEFYKVETQKVNEPPLSPDATVRDKLMRFFKVDSEGKKFYPWRLAKRFSVDLKEVKIVLEQLVSEGLILKDQSYKNHTYYVDAGGGNWKRGTLVKQTKASSTPIKSEQPEKPVVVTPTKKLGKFGFQERIEQKIQTYIETKNMLGLMGDKREKIDGAIHELEWVKKLLKETKP